MSLFDLFVNQLTSFFKTYNPSFNCLDTLQNSSYDEDKKVFLINLDSYNGMNVVSMDNVVKDGYVKLKNDPPTKHVPSSVDAFLIDSNNEWYFIEFKNRKISKCKDNLEKKGLNNILVLIDTFKIASKNMDVCFDNDNPIDFIKQHCTYIVVVSEDLDSYSYEQVRSADNLNEVYTPECLEKLKYFYFKDAFVYTPEFFERRFLKKFNY
ncbi:MAG: hypothetical protein K6E21_00450 [Bacilli bacterium]|nr:hypothetical protein [Bacilli bacterium]